MSAPAPRTGDPQNLEPEARGRSRLPLREAFAFALQSVQLRLGRMLVVILGIAFAVAFFAVLLGAEAILRGLQALAPRQFQAPADSSTLHTWWLVVALLIAVTGITNAVLMSVSERVREIGTLKCLGARGLHIVGIFLIELLLLGTAGGLLGALGGLLGTLWVYGSRLGKDLWLVFGWQEAGRIVGWSFLMAVGVSLLAAAIPVSLAARIEPAEAMRYDV